MPSAGLPRSSRTSLDDVHGTQSGLSEERRRSSLAGRRISLAAPSGSPERVLLRPNSLSSPSSPGNLRSASSSSGRHVSISPEVESPVIAGSCLLRMLQVMQALCACTTGLYGFPSCCSDCMTACHVQWGAAGMHDLSACQLPYAQACPPCTDCWVRLHWQTARHSYKPLHFMSS